MNYLIHPESLIFQSKAHIAGFNEMVRDEEIPQWDLLQTATEIAEEWTDDWDEDQGFGSSDGTFMIKDFIDTVIACFTNRKYKTDFKPSLQIVKL